MAVDSHLRESGPPDAKRTVLLLPGGMCSAGSYAEVMAQPALAQTRLVAATLPGQAARRPPDDYSVENYARSRPELATRVGADVVVGFSMGGIVAIEMIVSGAPRGRSVLLGVSLSPKDEPASSGRSSARPASWETCPMRSWPQGAASMVKRIRASPERQDPTARGLPLEPPHVHCGQLRVYCAGCIGARAAPNGCARRASRCGSCMPRRATAG